MIHAAALIITLGLGVASDPQLEADPAARIAVIGGDEPWRTTVREAIERFGEVGLDLPELVIYLHDDHAGCNDNNGRFRVTDRAIDLCRNSPSTARHELGHAWASTALTSADRARLVEHFGLDTWNSREVPWHRRGTEILAKALAWNLDRGRATAPNHRFAAIYEFATGKRSPRPISDASPDRSLTFCRPPNWIRCETPPQHRAAPYLDFQAGVSQLIRPLESWIPTNANVVRSITEWAMRDLNSRPLPCEDHEKRSMPAVPDSSVRRKGPRTHRSVQ